MYACLTAGCETLLAMAMQSFYSKLTRVSGLLKVLHSTDFPPKWPHDLVNFRNNCTRILLFACMLLEPWGPYLLEGDRICLGGPIL